MLLRFYFFILILFTAQTTWSQDNAIHCDINELSRLTTKDISVLSAFELFQLGVCEYRFNNFKRASSYFQSAEVRGFEDNALLNKYSKLCNDGLLATKLLEKSVLANTDDPFNPNLSLAENGLTKAATSPLENYNNSLQHDLLNYIFIIISFIGFLLALRLFLKFQKEQTHNIFLGIFILGISLMLFELALYWWKDSNYNPKVSFFRIQFFLWIPSFYLYMRNKLTAAIGINKKEFVIHYGVFIVALIALLILGNYNPTTDSSFSNFLSNFLNSLYFKSAHSTVYFILLLSLFTNNKAKLSTVNKNWLILLLSFIGIIMVLIYTRTLFEQIHSFDYLSKYFAAIVLSIFICVAGLMLFIQPEIITKAEEISPSKEPKYKNSGLTEDMLFILKVQLRELLELKKPYLDNTITLEKLAQELNTDRYSLSQVINQEFGKNFYEFINDYRVEETINIINKNKEIKSVNDLIYESGFNNRVSFYKAFKKRKNMTPMEYVKTVHP